jgi:hypothetical protein
MASASEAARWWPHPGHRAVHPRAAHLLQGGLLADDHLDHPRAAEVHRGVAVDHGDEVAERRDIGAAGRRRPEQRAYLRDRPGRADLGVEDLAGAAAAGEHLHLVGDPRAGRVDQVDHRQPRPVGLLDHPDDLLDSPGAPRSRLDRRVVGHQRDWPAADAGGAGDDAVGRQAVGQHVGERAVLSEAALVDEQRDPVPGELLALGRGLLVVPLRTARRDPGPDLGEVLVGGSGCCFFCCAHARERTTSAPGRQEWRPAAPARTLSECAG